MAKKRKKSLPHKIWHFIWHEDSVLSWVVNIIIAFVLIKFVFYPAIGFLLGTPYPIVAVVSESMQHNVHDGKLCGQDIDNFKYSDSNFWDVCGGWYEASPYEITKEKFKTFPFDQGFYKGDVIILTKANPKKLQVGDILVYQSYKPQPIIHRIVLKFEENGKTYFQTKGDHNKDSISTDVLYETRVPEDIIVGKGSLRIPYLGWIKILFVEAVRPFGIEIER